MEGQIHVFWNWIVAVDLFGAGLSAGAYIVSATAYFLGKKRYETITRIGAYIAPFPVLIGILCLIFDLERPALFWKLFLTFQPNSVMSLGSWLLLTFSIFSMIHFYLWLPERYDYLKVVPAIRCARRAHCFFLVGCVTVQEMREGPSEPACRSRLQTTLSRAGKESVW